MKQAEQQAEHIGMPLSIARAAMGAVLNSSVAFEECIVSFLCGCALLQLKLSLYRNSLIVMTSISHSIIGTEGKLSISSIIGVSNFNMTTLEKKRTVREISNERCLFCY